jgi:hypothetical protein
VDFSLQHRLQPTSGSIKADAKISAEADAASEARATSRQQNIES